MSKPRYIYVASPLGFSEAGRVFMYEKLIPEVLHLGYKILDPWTLTPEKDIAKIQSLPYGEERLKAWRKINPVIAKRNQDAIKKADGLLAILDGVDVDSGTSSEIGFAAALSKPILGYRGDFRLSADNEGSIVNLQVEYFIKLNGGRIVHSLQDIIKQLPKVIK